MSRHPWPKFGAPRCQIRDTSPHRWVDTVISVSRNVDDDSATDDVFRGDEVVGPVQGKIGATMRLDASVRYAEIRSHSSIDDSGRPEFSVYRDCSLRVLRPAEETEASTSLFATADAHRHASSRLTTGRSNHSLCRQQASDRNCAFSPVSSADRIDS